MGGSDEAYRNSFDDIRMIRGMFDGIVQPADNYGPELPGVNDLDWAKAVLLNPDFAGMGAQQYAPDSVWRIPYFHGKEPQFLLLMKQQPTIDPGMALWVLTSVALLYQDLLRGGHIPPGAYYPQVMPVVVYTGPVPWNAATRLITRIDSCPQMRHLQPDISYILIDQQELRKQSRRALERILIQADAASISPVIPGGEPEDSGLRL